jgi:hypothetical protein
MDDIPVGLSPVLIELSQYGSDIEDTVDDLIWMVNETIEYRYIKFLSIIRNDILEIVPLLNVSGHVNIHLTLKDKDGGIATKSNITIHVDSLITELTPKVTLISPINGSVVSTLTPTLEWKLEYSGDEIITYSIYLDRSPEPPDRIIRSNVSTTSYILETELEDRTTYSWKVIPRDGVCLSEQFYFTVNLSYKPDYKVNLSSEKDYIKLHPGSKVEINLTVRNEGILDDWYEIEYNSGTLQKYTYIDRILIQLPSIAESVLKLTIIIPEDFELDVYSVLIAAKSLSDVTVNDEIAITIEVVKKKFIPDYRVSVSVSPEIIQIYPGETANVTLSITNFGNIVDEYIVSFISDIFLSNNIFLEKNSVSLNSSEIRSLKVQISVLESTVIGVYNITYIIHSEYAMNQTTLTIHVKAKEVSSEPGHEGKNILIFIVVGIIILIIILIILILLRKRSKSSGQSLVPSKTNNLEPDEIALSETTSLTTETSENTPLPESLDQPAISKVIPEAPESVPTLSLSVPTPTLESKSGQTPISLPTIQPSITQQFTPVIVQQPQLIPQIPESQTQTQNQINVESLAHPTK